MSCNTVVLGIAHEMGHMLTLISGWAQFWESQQISEPSECPPARYVYIGVARIRHSLERLTWRPRGLSGVSIDQPWKSITVAQGRGHSEVNVNRLVDTTLAALDPRIGEGYVIEHSLVPAPWPVVADYWALEIVLTILLMDAATASVPGSRLVIRTANIVTPISLAGTEGTVAAGRYVAISVQMSADHTGEPRATSLGSPGCRAVPAQGQLPICRAIVQEHGGLLQVACATTGETTSIVYLPAVCTRASTDVEPAHARTADGQCCN